MVRVSEYYSDYCMAGVEAIIIKDERLSNGSVLLGFPLDSELGWSHSDFLDYGCWFVEFSHL